MIEIARPDWPPLAYGEWKDTLYALHRWAQIIGKIRVKTTTLVNHEWNSTLRVTPRGLTSRLIPNGHEGYQIELDLVGHELSVASTTGGRASMPLGPSSVAAFWKGLHALLAQVGVTAPHINEKPNEVTPAIPFSKDVAPRPYDRGAATRFLRALLSTEIAFERFRAGFVGKASPVQFFWGGFDLALSRFSGRRAPGYAGGVPPNTHPHVMHEAYSHELIAHGFWCGDASTGGPEYYAYPMPALAGIEKVSIAPAEARWDKARGEFLLPYDAVRTAADPDEALMSFLESTYTAMSGLAGWDRGLSETNVPCFCETVPSSLRRGAA